MSPSVLFINWQSVRYSYQFWELISFGSWRKVLIMFRVQYIMTKDLRSVYNIHLLMEVTVDFSLGLL